VDRIRLLVWCQFCAAVGGVLLAFAVVAAFV
jgi:hypothetical protein